MLKQAINDKLQGSVVTYLRCDGAVNNQIKKGLLLRLPVIFNRFRINKFTAMSLVSPFLEHGVIRN